MKPIEIKGISWSFILVGILYFVEFYFDLGINVPIWGGILLIALSLWLVFNGFQANAVKNIIWGAINFFVGISIFTIWYFDVISVNQYVLPLMAFTSFAVFLMLFIDNTKAKPFLILSIVAIIVFAGLVVFKDTLFINRINQYIAILLSYKTILFIIVGISLMLIGKDN